jgi:hypothetical protein
MTDVDNVDSRINSHGQLPIHLTAQLRIAVHGRQEIVFLHMPQSRAKLARKWSYEKAPTFMFQDIARQSFFEV